MIIIKNKFIPFKGFWAINICGIIFQRSDTKELTPTAINHESIHTAQMKELLYIGFYLIYILEYLYKVFEYGDKMMAYRNISFEKEAFANEANLDYLRTRKMYAQW